MDNEMPRTLSPEDEAIEESRKRQNRVNLHPGATIGPSDNLEDVIERTEVVSAEDDEK